MKKLLYLFVFLFVLLPLTRAADSAYDLILLQQNSANTGKVQVNITPVASSLVGFNTSKLPVNIALGTNLSLSGTTLNATGGGTPAGSSGDIQTNSSGAFGHITPGANIVTFLTSALPTTLAGYGITNGVANTVTVNGHALSSNVTVTNADLGAVPTTTTVNGHALSSNVTVTNSDLGAVPTTTTVNGHALSSNVTVTTGDLGLGTMATQSASNVLISGGVIYNPPTTASAGGTVVLSNGSDVYINPYTSNTSFTLPGSPSAGYYFRIHFEACDGASIATFSGTVNRNGFSTSGTVYTPAPAGNHVVYGRYINGAWYESDDFSSNTVANGGTGATTFTIHGVLLGQTTSPLTATAAGAADTILTGMGASDPTFQYPHIHVNSQSAAYTTLLTDQGDIIYHPSADTTARTWTIDSNANVAAPIGTSLSFYNDTSAGTVTIAITSDTLVLSPAGTTGSVTLLAGHTATAVKVASTRWFISMN
jgi:hypothetical protein